ncbi:hypothetical protein ACFL6B_04075 [Thermodesulfobacteriota bacterium]
MPEDIRDKSHISNEDVIGLNFIRSSGCYVFRKYYKQGLRSQIMEVLDPDDIVKQNKGEIIDGVRFFPWAKPLKILRIFRSRFNSVEDAFEEIKKLRIVEKYLPRESYAKSDEFIVDYRWNGKQDVILCGLQEYVEGEVLNPWKLTDTNYLADLFTSMRVEGHHGSMPETEELHRRVWGKAIDFVNSAKKMILEANYVPDFAGVANLLLTPSGEIRLVDINNISRVSLGPDIILDDKDYPVCDKSIEAISILERHLMKKPLDMSEKIYRTFLDPQRMKDVKALEEKFHLAIEHEAHYPV